MSIRHVSEVSAPIAEVFAWHGRAGAFTRLAPPWLPATIVQESDSLRDGVAVLRLPGGLTWVARHDPDGYQPPNQFVEELSTVGLRSLPAHLALRWRHTHSFAEDGPASTGAASTTVIDQIDTPIGSRRLRAMFRYRHAQLAEDLASHREAAQHGLGQITVAVTGSSGLIGTALCAFLSTGGHRVIRLVRRNPRNETERRWNPMNPDPALLDGVDAVIHLAGASIGGRFTRRRKRELRDSRIEPTRLLATVAAAGTSGPRVFVSASAIGIYGAARGDEVLTEGSSLGAGFLPTVVADWEAGTAPARDAGLRVVNVRTGIVQSPRGGPLQLFLPLFRAGLGGTVGTGKQWLPWIDIDDLLDVYLRALYDIRMAGPVNAVAPNAVRNAEYTKTLARVLKRPAILPVPAFATRLLLTPEGSRELVEASQHVVPQRLAELGHRFRRPELESALRHQLGRFLS